MPKAPKARFDKAGLTGLGLDKLVEILLDEAAVNKALKGRLQAALAGGAGTDEVARLVDQKLDSYQKAKTYLSPTRANTLSVELRGLLRMITAELAALDAYSAFERLIRFLIVGTFIEERARKGGAKLAKLLDEAREGLVDVALKLGSNDQVRAVALLEKIRVADEEGKCQAALLRIYCGLEKQAADAWTSVLKAKLVPATDRGALWRNAELLTYLQRLAVHNADIDAFIDLELRRPTERQDSLLIARMLHDAKRHAEALDWVRKPPATMRLTRTDQVVADPARPPKLLEADILDALRRKDEAQAIRWNEFARTFQPDILRDYIARLDDFAEFEEMDNAFALVAASPLIHEALDFLVKWPRLDLASDQVLRHLRKWDGRQFAILVTSADALARDYPVAATMLYRVVLDDILRRGDADDYADGATYYAMLCDLLDRLDADFPYQSHDDYVIALRGRHPRKYGFWNLIPTQRL